jgi:hypothetical protein
MRKAKHIFLIIFGVAIFMYILKATNKSQTTNDFARKLIQPQITFKSAINLSVGQFVFAGRLDTNVKLNIYSDRYNFYQIDYRFRRLDTIKIPYSNQFHLNTLNIYKDNQGSNYYSGNPYGEISVFNEQSAKCYKINGLQFDFIQAISPNSVIVRSRYNYGTQLNRSLTKLNFSYDAKIDGQFRFPAIKDGIFGNDGMLLYDKKNARILYMYFYRGEILSLDTNLNFVYSAKTIDTVKAAKVKTAIIKVKLKNGDTLKRIIQTTTPVIVSTYLTTNRDKIYTISNLKADNESRSDFSSNTVVDVYNIKTGLYLHSFYIPKYNGEKTTSFQIVGQKLLAIDKIYLVTYDFVESDIN